MKMALCALSISISSAAFAQDPAQRPLQPPSAQPAADQPATTEAQPVPPLWTVSLGLGVADFTGDMAGDSLDVGLAYEVRVAYRFSDLVTLEGAYIGSSHSLSAFGIDADLSSNGLEALARLDLSRIYTTEIESVPVSPFLVGGLALQQFSLSSEASGTAAFADDDNVLSIPIGAGAAGSIGRVQLDARLVYRTTFNEDLFRAPDGRNADASLAHWTLSARAGFGF